MSLYVRVRDRSSLFACTVEMAGRKCIRAAQALVREATRAVKLARAYAHVQLYMRGAVGMRACVYVCFLVCVPPVPMRA